MLCKHLLSLYNLIYIHFLLWCEYHSCHFYLSSWHLSLLEEVERSPNLVFQGSLLSISLPVVLFLHSLGSGPLLAIPALKTTGDCEHHVSLCPFALKTTASEACKCDQEGAASKKRGLNRYFDSHPRNQVQKVKSKTETLLVSSCQWEGGRI